MSYKGGSLSRYAVLATLAILGGFLLASQGILNDPLSMLDNPQKRVEEQIYLVSGTEFADNAPYHMRNSSQFYASSSGGPRAIEFTFSKENVDKSISVIVNGEDLTEFEPLQGSHQVLTKLRPGNNSIKLISKSGCGKTAKSWRGCYSIAISNVEIIPLKEYTPEISYEQGFHHPHGLADPGNRSSAKIWWAKEKAKASTLLPTGKYLPKIDIHHTALKSKENVTFEIKGKEKTIKVPPSGGNFTLPTIRLSDISSVTISSEIGKCRVRKEDPRCLSIAVDDIYFQELKSS